MFDKVSIVVKGGDGGDGLVSFRREKFVPFGGPDGGDGGDGGKVILVADETVTSLKVLARKRYYRAGDGGNGGRKKKHGKNGKDLLLAVPPGTVVSYRSQIGDNNIIADLDQPGQMVVVARGGKGGFGNAHFATSTNQAPRIAQPGEKGEEKEIVLELKLIADVGLIGYPNVGKSSLLAKVSAAKPRIADYPFTTREPMLGVVEFEGRNFVLAEIPGLIDGAHLGRGLGHDFLRHVMRTRVLIHLVDGSSPSPVDDMIKVNSELGLFDSALLQKPQLVAVNKIDLPGVRVRLDEIRKNFNAIGVRVFFISALTGEGIPELVAQTTRLLEQTAAPEPIRLKKVFRPQPKG